MLQLVIISNSDTVIINDYDIMIDYITMNEIFTMWDYVTIGGYVMSRIKD